MSCCDEDVVEVNRTLYLSCVNRNRCLAVELMRYEDAVQIEDEQESHNTAHGLCRMPGVVERQGQDKG